MSALLRASAVRAMASGVAVGTSSAASAGLRGMGGGLIRWPSHSSSSISGGVVNHCFRGSSSSCEKPPALPPDASTTRPRVRASSKAAGGPRTGTSSSTPSAAVLGQSELSWIQRNGLGVMDHRGGEHAALLTRYPGLCAGGTLRALDYFGTCVFAVSGAMAASASGMDLVGGCLIGVVTAVGGGTVRDLMVGQHPVFWLVEKEYLVMAVICASAAFLMAPYAQERWPEGPMADAWASFMKWGDAIGVGAFAIIGSHCGLRRKMPFFASILFGLMTATFGGITRDVICQRPVRVLHNNRDQYATVALCSAAAYISTTLMGFHPALRVASGIGTSLVGRYWATHRDPAQLAKMIP